MIMKQTTEQKRSTAMAAEIVLLLKDRNYGLAEAKATALVGQLMDEEGDRQRETAKESDMNRMELSLDMATVFYLGMYRADGKGSTGACWLKHDVAGGWRISIDELNMMYSVNTMVYFRSRVGSSFPTKEDAMYFFEKWTRQRGEI